MVFIAQSGVINIRLNICFILHFVDLNIKELLGLLII